MPVTTRSRSGKLPAPRNQALLKNSVDKPTVDVPNKGTSKQSPTKHIKNRRARNDVLMAATTNLKNPLLSISLDILFEIMHHLSPYDLVHLALTCKPFRKTLLSRDVAFLWKASYSHLPHAPRCPEDLSEPAWAFFLFGGTHCHTCGGDRDTYHNMYLHRRICTECQHKHVCRDRYVFERLLPQEMLPCLPAYFKAFCDPAKHQSGLYEGGFWYQDILSLQAELSPLLETLTGENLQAALITVRERKVSALRAREKHAKCCLEWIRRCEETLRGEIHTRFSTLGHHVRDYVYIHVGKSDFLWTIPLCDQEAAWDVFYAIQKPKIDQHRLEREKEERHSRLRKRRIAISDVYVQYLQTEVLPLRQPTFPSEHDISYIPETQGLVDNDIKPSHQFMEEAKQLLSTLTPTLRTWADSRSAAAFASIPLSILPRPLTESTLTRELQSDITNSPLELAVSVFKCEKCGDAANQMQRSSRYLAGLEILAHRCKMHYFEAKGSADPPLPLWDERGSKLVTDLLKLLCLDPATTTALDLNTRNDRFACLTCGIRLRYEGHVARKGWPAMGWRECLEHVCERGGSPTFRLLTPAQTEIALERERVESHPQDCWGCCHCMVHITQHNSLVRWLLIREVTKHINVAHDIQDPIEGRDYFYNPRLPRIERRYTVVGVDDEDD